VKEPIERGSGFAQAEPTAIEQDTRDIDDRERLAEEARAQAERMAKELRAAKVPIEAEPPTGYRP